MEHLNSVLGLCGIFAAMWIPRGIFSLIFQIFLLMALVIFMGTRWEFGNDFFNYSNLFLCSLKNNCGGDVYWEPLYNIIAQFLHYANLGFPEFLLVIASFSLIVKFVVFKKSIIYGEVCFWIYMMIYGLPIEAGSMRQGLALSFLFASFFSLVENRHLTFLIFALLACAAHLSAITVIPFFVLSILLARSRFSLPLICLSSFSLFLGFLCLPPNQITHVIQEIIGKTGNSAFIGKAAFYLKNLQFAGQGDGGLIQELKHLFIILLFIVVHKSKLLGDVLMRSALIVFLFGVYLAIYFGPNTELGIRLPAYFIPFEVVALGGVLIYSAKRYKENSLAILSLVCIFLILRNFKFFSGIWHSNYANYNSWLFM